MRGTAEGRTTKDRGCSCGRLRVAEEGSWLLGGLELLRKGWLLRRGINAEERRRGGVWLQRNMAEDGGRVAMGGLGGLGGGGAAGEGRGRGNYSVCHRPRAA